MWLSDKKHNETSTKKCTKLKHQVIFELIIVWSRKSFEFDLQCRLNSGIFANFPSLSQLQKVGKAKSGKQFKLYFT